MSFVLLLLLRIVKIRNKINLFIEIIPYPIVCFNICYLLPSINVILHLIVINRTVWNGLQKVSFI